MKKRTILISLMLLMSLWNVSVSLSAGRDYALNFDGTNDYVDVGDFSLNGLNITITAWVKNYNPKAENNRIIDFGGGEANDNLILDFDGTTGKMEWVIYNDDDRKGDIKTTDVFPSGEWVHVAVVQGNGTATIYWDAVNKVSGSVGNGDSQVRDRQYIGKSNFSGDDYFDGKIDEVTVWNRALSQSEIEKMRFSFTGLPDDTTNLVAHWTFSEGSGTMTADSSGNGHTATLVNGPNRVNPRDPQFTNSGAITLDFGNLYRYGTNDNNTAYVYNNTVKRTITLTTGGGSGLSTLKRTWQISGLPPLSTNTAPQRDVSVSKTSETVAQSSSSKIDVIYNPTIGSGGGGFELSYFDLIKIKDNVGNRTVTAKANVYATPTVSRIAPALGSNGRVNVAKSSRVTFKAQSTPLFPGATVKGFEWQKVSGNTTTPDATKWELSANTEQKDYTFDNTGDFTVFARMVDSNNVATAPLAIPVTAWNPPVVSDTALAGADFSTAHNRYFGEVNQPVTPGATGQTQNSNATEQITQFRWDLDKDGVFGESGEIQTAGSTLTYTPTTATLSDIIKCKAVTNYGVESSEKQFTFRIYNTVQANPGGPYNGRPNQAVTLKGSINTASDPGATFTYQWKVQQTSGGALEAVTTNSDGSATNTWTADGVYSVELTATVTTEEGLVLSGTGTTTVTVESGRPTAMPGGPYRGGIDGGNFTPIQFEGNPPGFIEAADIGEIVDWTWNFPDGTNLTERALEFNGSSSAAIVNPISNFPSTEIAAVFWMKSSDSSNQGTPLSYASTATSNDFLIFDYKNLSVLIANISTGASGVSANDGKWHHIAVTWKSSNGESNFIKTGSRCSPKPLPQA